MEYMNYIFQSTLNYSFRISKNYLLIEITVKCVNAIIYQ